MQKLLQWALVIWFIAISVLIIVPAVMLLFVEGDKPLPGAFLPPPTAPVIAEIKLGTDDKFVAQQAAIAAQQAAVFASSVKAYETYAAGYKADLEIRKLSGPQQTFTLVVKDALVTLLTGVAAAFVGIAFVASATGVVDNLNRMRSNIAPERLRIFNFEPDSNQPQRPP